MVTTICRGGDCPVLVTVKWTIYSWVCCYSQDTLEKKINYANVYSLPVEKSTDTSGYNRINSVNFQKQSFLNALSLFSLTSELSSNMMWLRYCINRDHVCMTTASITDSAHYLPSLTPHTDSLSHNLPWMSWVQISRLPTPTFSAAGSEKEQTTTEILHSFSPSFRFQSEQGAAAMLSYAFIIWTWGTVCHDLGNRKWCLMMSKTQSF